MQVDQPSFRSYPTRTHAREPPTLHQQERFARFGRSLEGKTIAWVGDGNNVLHSFMVPSWACRC